MKSALAALAVLAVVVSCTGTTAPRPQWVVTISSDAPIPELGDRLLVQIIDASGQTCAGCLRTFALTSASSLPMSFGLEPGEDPAPRVWATLFRQEQSGEDGRPADAAHLEALGQLPAASGVTTVSLELPMRCFGVAADPVANTTCDPATGTSSPSPLLQPGAGLATGSWSPSHAVPCPSAAADGMVCVPGGAFLLGSHSVVALSGGTAAFPEHLVQLSPFFLDVDEVTVAHVRALLDAGSLPASATPVVRVPGPPGLSVLAGGCTYGTTACSGPPPDCTDMLPVNCITYDQAAAVCSAMGKRLPTEAEWEYAARNLSVESTFPWGEDTDVCEEAAVALGRGAETKGFAPEYDTCRLVDGGVLQWGPVPVGTTLDVTTLGVHDMGGNVAEWVMDAFQTYDDTCWSGGTPQLVDPSCTTPSAAFPGARSVRGGSWTLQGIYAASAMRNDLPATTSLPGYGVRCAKSL